MSHRLYLYNKAEIGSSEDDCLPLMEWGYELPLLLHPLFAQGACVGHNCYNDPHSEEGLYAEAPAGIEALRAFYAFIERHAGSLAGGQPLAEEQRADQYAHQRRGGVEDRRVAGRQHQRRQAIHHRGQPGVDHAEDQAGAKLALVVPQWPHQQQEGQQAEGAEAGTEEGGRQAAQHRHGDAHEQEAGAPDGGEQQQAEQIGGFHQRLQAGAARLRRPPRGAIRS